MDFPLLVGRISPAQHQGRHQGTRPHLFLPCHVSHCGLTLFFFWTPKTGRQKTHIFRHFIAFWRFPKLPLLRPIGGISWLDGRAAPGEVEARFEFLPGPRKPRSAPDDLSEASESIASSSGAVCRNSWVRRSCMSDGLGGARRLHLSLIHI